MGYSTATKKRAKKDIKELGKIYKRGDLTLSEYRTEKVNLLRFLR